MESMSFYEFSKMMEEDERNIQARPCCLNCKFYSRDYGMDNCYYDEFQEEYELCDQCCSKWRSYLTGKSMEVKDGNNSTTEV